MKAALLSIPILGVSLLAAAPRAAPPGNDDELSGAKVQLRSGDKRVRKRAVEKLAALGTPEAWTLVIGALDDDRGEVADTAQLVLGALPAGKQLRALHGRAGLTARDPWVRRRSAELLARVEGPVRVRDLARALSDRDPDVRWTLLWTLERRAGSIRLHDDFEKHILPAVRRLAVRERDPHVRGRALLALAALDPEAAKDPVRQGIEDRKAPVRCAAVGLATTILGGEEAASLLRRCSEDEAIAVRTRTVDALVQLGTAEAVRILVERLEKEKEVRLGWRLVETLQRITGRKFRRDPRPWRRFAEGLSAEWSPDEGEGVPGALGEDRSRSFAGLSILSGRVAFLIDLSGSIWYERADGTTYKEVIDGKLRAALESLPPDALFNVVPFTATPHPWKEKLTAATPGNVRRAIRYFEECRAQGSGNVWDAIVLALEDPEVDTLFILTDGAPTGGRRNRLELMIPLLEQRNATRMVAMDSVLVGATPKLQRAWADLARRTGGRSLAVDL